MRAALGLGLFAAVVVVYLRTLTARRRERKELLRVGLAPIGAVGADIPIEIVSAQLYPDAPDARGDDLVRVRSTTIAGTEVTTFDHMRRPTDAELGHVVACARSILPTPHPFAVVRRGAAGVDDVECSDAGFAAFLRSGAIAEWLAAHPLRVVVIAGTDALAAFDAEATVEGGPNLVGFMVGLVDRLLALVPDPAPPPRNHLSSLE